MSLFILGIVAAIFFISGLLEDNTGVMILYFVMTAILVGMAISVSRKDNKDKS